MAKKKNKHRKRFAVTVITTLILDLDDRLTPDDEWRSQFYSLHGLNDVAKHIAYNIVANGVQRISQLDGFADRADDTCEIGSIDTDVDEVRDL